jgi:hypothetical protein
MQTLIFNTTKKTIFLWSESPGESEILITYDRISTVKVGEGFYEAMQREESSDDKSIVGTYPVFRCPISNTNMIIEK